MIDADSLPLTQGLVMEVLAARYRAGDPTWTFSNRAKPALRALEALRLVWFKGAVTYGNQLAGLTDEGLAACTLTGYRSTWQQKWEETPEAEDERRLMAEWEARESGSR